MATVNPYLNFNGNAEEAFNLYKSVFGGEFTFIGKFKDMPANVPGFSEEEGEKIMHVSLPIGNTTIFGSDIPSSYPAGVAGNTFSVSVNTDSEAEADKIFKGLSDGGNIMMPLAKTFWGAYFGMLTDRFGVQWMVNYDYPQEG
jgi:PhnB protein